MSATPALAFPLALLQRLRAGAETAVNAFSRRTPLLVVLLGGALPMGLLWPVQGARPYLVLWVVGYGLLGWVWLRDALVAPPADAPGESVRSRGIAAAFGLVCGLPVLFSGPQPEAQASLVTLALYLSLAVCATAIKRPLSGLWFARLLLGAALVATLRKEGAFSVVPLIHLLFAWGFSEILSRRAAFLRSRFLALAARQQEAAAQLRARTQELEQSQASRVRLVGALSREVRQPLHVLGLMVERLSLEPGAASLQPQIGELVAAVRPLALALTQLVDFSQLDAGTVKVRKSEQSIHALMALLQREGAPEAARRGHTLACRSELDVRIETDIDLLGSALWHVLRHALLDTGHADVRVFTSHKDRHDIWLHIATRSVRWQHGEPDDVFGAFSHGQTSASDPHGLSLGTAIVRRTAELLGLTLEVGAKDGDGSEFRISLPCSRQWVARAHQATTMARPSTVSRSLVGLRTVLVDNDESVLRGIDSMARSWGCVPLSCSSVPELAEKLAQMPGQEFDCVVADFHLASEGPTGLDAIEVVRNSMTRFVAATIFTGDVNIRSADLRLDDVHVAHKPVVPARIRMMLEDMAAETQRYRQVHGQAPAASLDDEWAALSLDDAAESV